MTEIDVNFQNISQLWQQQRERIRNHQTIQVVRTAAKSRKFKIKTRKLMHAVTKSVFPLEIQNDMLHFFLIKVVKRKSQTLEEKLEINM